MCYFKVILLLSIGCSTLLHAQNATQTSDNKTEEAKEKSEGFMSKVADWLFESQQPQDSLVQETRRVQHQQYGPPPPTQNNCNPCNKEPWIPMAGYTQQHHQNHQQQHHQQQQQHHHQQHHSNLHQNLHPPLPGGNYGPPANSYGPPPVNYGPPQQNYGPPKYEVPDIIPAQQVFESHTVEAPVYGPPHPTFRPQAPVNSYGPPKSQQLPLQAPANFGFAQFGGNSQFGKHYGPPQPNFHAPLKNYGPPSNQPTYGPPKPVFGGKSPRKIRPKFNKYPTPPYKFIPVKGKYTNLPSDFNPPPPPPPQNYPMNYQQLPKFENHFLRPPVVFNANVDVKSQITNPEYLPPPEQLPISSGHNDPQEAAAVPYPNLSPGPVAPLHNAQNFLDPNGGSVQIQQSIPVADFVASIDHPINVVRSPIVEVNVANASAQSDYYASTENTLTTVHFQHTFQTHPPPHNYNTYDKLSDHPIVVDDAHVAAATYSNKTVNSAEINNGLFLNQIIGFPSITSPFTSMQPPSVSTWVTNYNLQQTTKKPKQIQIIIPYTTNNRLAHSNNVRPDFYKGSESQEIAVNHKPNSVVNIQELFKNKQKESRNPQLPFDVIRLQKNIDDWTEQEYSKKMMQKTTPTLAGFTTTPTKVSKPIPDEYLTTVPYNPAEKATTRRPYVDHEAAGSISKEYLDTNLVSSSTEKPKKLLHWDKIHVAVSPLTKEKIYVVTPQPKHNTTFSISITPMRNASHKSDVRVVLSEWPHLINNLATTTKASSAGSSTATTSTTTSRPTSRHPLFGLMDLSSYAPSSNATAEIYSGHSKVINVVTSALKKRDTEKVTTTVKPSE